jgi:thiol-disulfide isomerase/thioredoxin
MKTKITLFSADWCTSCKIVYPLFKGIKYELVNLSTGDAAEDRAMKENVSSLPTLIFYQNGIETFRHIGIFSAGDLKRMMDEYGGSE